jgi:uncharacterized protein with HEPN domain
MRSDRAFLIDIITHARLIHEKRQTVTKEQFDQDPFLQHAMARLLEIIGEAARCVTEPTRDQYPLPWKQIVGMRHRIVHEYHKVDPEMIWTTISDDVPPMIAILAPSVDAMIEARKLELGKKEREP